MYKRITTLIVISLVITVLLSNLGYKTYAAGSLRLKVAIVYDRTSNYGYNDNLVANIQELVGAFNTEAATINVEDYKAGEIKNYDYVFVIGIEGNLNQGVFLHDLKSYNNKICWIGNGIGDFLKDNSKYDLSYLGTKQDFTEVYYTNKRSASITINDMDQFFLGTKNNFPIVQGTNKEPQVYGYLSDGTNNYPYIIKEKNLWYISNVDDNNVEFYIFSDLLNDIFQVSNINKGKVFVRIEDVHPFRDVNELKKIADYLYDEGIPFMIALIPVYVNPNDGAITTMSEKKDFVQAIKYMQDHGGTVILHGYTHQNSSGTASGEGFEFWDDKNDAPLNVNMSQYVYDKVSKGLEECVSNQIYPLAFEAPHYAIDSRGYKELKKYFSTYVGQFQSSDEKFTTTAFPYILNNTEDFNKFIPENLGYFQLNDPTSLGEIENNFDQVSIVRGYTAGFFFHPYIDIKYLKQIIEMLKSKNVDFFDLKQEENWVKCDGMNISSRNGEITFEGKVNLPSTNKIISKNQVKITGITYINKILIVIISVFCVVFLIIFILSKKISRNRFLR